MSYSEALSVLMDGTKFEINSESEILTSCRLRTQTPVEVLNILLGGGLPLSGVYHTWGLPKGGKSTWLYQSMGMFQKQYPNGVCCIVDTESSADSNRLRALGIDHPELVLRLPTTSIESGFVDLMKVVANKQSKPELKEVPLFIIWDTISRGMATDDSKQSRMNAQDRARVIKNYMPQLCSEVEKQPFILGLIRPVIYVPSGLDVEILELVTAHELAHLKRLDHWWKPLGLYYFQCIGLPLCAGLRISFFVGILKQLVMRELLVIRIKNT